MLYFMNIQRDRSQLDTALWVMSLDTDYISLEEPDWSEQSGAYHEPPLARMERQKQQASKNQISNQVAAIENDLGIRAAWEKHLGKEKEKNLRIIRAWEKTYIHVHNKAVPDQKVWPAKMEKQKEILVGNEKSKVVRKVNNQKDLRKMKKQLRQSEQVTTIVSKAVDTAKTHDQQHRELSRITKPVAASVKKDRKEVKEDEKQGENKDWDDGEDGDDFLTPEVKVEYLTLALMTLAAEIHYQVLMMDSVDDDWEHGL